MMCDGQALGSGQKSMVAFAEADHHRRRKMPGPLNRGSIDERRDAPSRAERSHW